MNQLVCYCFGYTAGDIERDFRRNGRSTIAERIARDKRFGNCRCGEKNPKGR